MFSFIHSVMLPRALSGVKEVPISGLSLAD